MLLKSSVMLAVAVSLSIAPAAERAAAPPTSGTGPVFKSIGPLTFSPEGLLCAGDTQSAAIFALELGPLAEGGAVGAKAIAGIDQQLAAMLGTDVREIAVTDLVVHPKTRNAYLSIMRGQGANTSPVLLRIDGAGKIDVLAFDKIKFSRVELPNAPAASDASSPRNPRTQSITDMAFIEGRLYVAGLSNEEFSSKLRSVAYPFSTVDNGTSVEIYHGNHGAFETRSPVYTFVPYKVNGETNLIAGCLCTPLVKFPVGSLKAGAKVMGTTIAELGNRNRPLDMVVYKKNGAEYLLMSNNSRGVMKIPTAGFGTAEKITAPVASETSGVPFETVTSMKGVEQLDLLDDRNTLILARSEAGALNLAVVALP